SGHEHDLAVHGPRLEKRGRLAPERHGEPAGAPRPGVARVLPRSLVREAHELLESRAVHGKIVLVPGR
ncbi:MAG: hypothetical protein ACK57N_00590, partial [Planctomycetia bacterium]